MIPDSFRYLAIPKSVACRIPFIPAHNTHRVNIDAFSLQIGGIGEISLRIFQMQILALRIDLIFHDSSRQP